MKLRIEQLEAQPLLSLRRHVTPEQVGDTVGEFAGRLFPAAGDKATGLMVSRWHTWEDTGGDMEVGVVTTAPVAVEGDILSTELPAGRAAVGEHVGSYAGLAAAWGAFKEAMAAQGLEAGTGPASAPWEEYVSDCSVTPEDELVTRIVWPLA